MGRKSEPGELVGSGIASGHVAGLAHRLRVRLGELTAGAAAAAERRVVFIVGTGRSGTHWLGWICESHPELAVTIERPPIFEWVTEAAIHPDRAARLLPKLVRRYTAEARLCEPRLYVDKSHPNLWLADELAAALPRAKFIGVRRGVHGTVASMLQHAGVLRWVQEWRRYPVPNRFLGITSAWAEHYEALSLPARCALRWKAHEAQLDALAARLGERFLSLTYEDIFADPPGELARIQAFLGLTRPFPLPEIKRASLDRWRDELSAADLADIDAVLATAR